MTNPTPHAMNETYRIKAVVWEKRNSSYVYLNGVRRLEVFRFRSRWAVLGDSDVVSSGHANIEAAKAAAESWYRSKLLEALEPVND